MFEYQISWGIWLLLFLGGYLGGENSVGEFSPMRRRLPISNILHSYLFPARYLWDGQVWDVQPRLRNARSPQGTKATVSTPLPGLLSRIPLSARINDTLWTIRELPSQKLDFRIYIYEITSSHFRLGPHGAQGLTIALATVLYYNLVAKP